MRPKWDTKHFLVLWFNSWFAKVTLSSWGPQLNAVCGSSNYQMVPWPLTAAHDFRAPSFGLYFFFLSMWTLRQGSWTYPWSSSSCPWTQTSEVCSSLWPVLEKQKKLSRLGQHHLSSNFGLVTFYLCHFGWGFFPFWALFNSFTWGREKIMEPIKSGCGTD